MTLPRSDYRKEEAFKAGIKPQPISELFAEIDSLNDNHVEGKVTCHLKGLALLVQLRCDTSKGLQVNRITDFSGRNRTAEFVTHPTVVKRVEDMRLRLHYSPDCPGWFLLDGVGVKYHPRGQPPRRVRPKMRR